MLTRYWLEEQSQSESFKNERMIGNSKLVVSLRRNESYELSKLWGAYVVIIALLNLKAKGCWKESSFVGSRKGVQLIENEINKKKRE